MAELRLALETFLDRVWGDADQTAIFELMAPDAEIDGLEEVPTEGAAGYAAFHRMMVSSFSQMRVAIDRSIEDGEWIAASGIITGRHDATGAAARARVQMMVRFAGGMVVEARNFIDFIALFEQAGTLPERTLDNCLLGRPFSLRPHPVRLKVSVA